MGSLPNDVFFSVEKLPTFNEWLLARYDTTPITEYVLNKRTGRYGDYDKMMAWYRKRYRLEMERLRELCVNNPFINNQTNNQED